MPTSTPAVVHAGAAQTYRLVPEPRPHGAGAVDTPDDAPDFWGGDGFGFDDLLDLINPLQHIPVLSALYREVTGDRIAPGPRLLGAALYGGGPIGAALSVAGAIVNIGVENSTGEDVGAHVLAFLAGEDADGAPPGDAAPRQVAEVDGLPWLEGEATTPQAVTEIDGLPWLTAQGGRERLPAAVAVAELPPPAPHQGARADPAPGPPTVTETRSPLLLAALVQPPAKATAGGDVAPSDPPADIAGTMAEALDKYTALLRSRAASDSGASDLF